MPRTIKLMPALAGVLALLLAVEWILPGPVARDIQPPVIHATGWKTSDAEAGHLADIILARPLLAASRRPPSETVAVVSDVLPRLSAIVIAGGRAQAIFTGPDDKPQLVKTGGQIGDYRVKTVTADKVYLLGPSGQLVVRPQFDTAGGGGITPSASASKTSVVPSPQLTPPPPGGSTGSPGPASPPAS